MFIIHEKLYYHHEGGEISKGNPKLIATLNDLLADELTAINQYIVLSEMANNWGYKKLHEAFRNAPSTR